MFKSLSTIKSEKKPKKTYFIFIFIDKIQTYRDFNVELNSNVTNLIVKSIMIVYDKRDFVTNFEFATKL